MLKERRFWEGKQSKFLEEHRLVDGQQLKAEIRADSYDFQSHARISMLTDNGWEFLYAIPYPMMRSTKFGPMVDFLDDVDELFEKAEALLLYGSKIGD